MSTARAHLRKNDVGKHFVLSPRSCDMHRAASFPSYHLSPSNLLLYFYHLIPFFLRFTPTPTSSTIMATKRVFQLLPLRASSTLLGSQYTIPRRIAPQVASRATSIQRHALRPQHLQQQQRWHSSIPAEQRSKKYEFADVRTSAPIPSKPDSQKQHGTKQSKAKYTNTHHRFKTSSPTPPIPPS